MPDGYEGLSDANGASPLATLGLGPIPSVGCGDASATALPQHRFRKTLDVRSWRPPMWVGSFMAVGVPPRRLSPGADFDEVPSPRIE